MSSFAGVYSVYSITKMAALYYVCLFVLGTSAVLPCSVVLDEIGKQCKPYLVIGQSQAVNRTFSGKSKPQNIYE